MFLARKSGKVFFRTVFYFFWSKPCNALPVLLNIVNYPKNHGNKSQNLLFLCEQK